MGAEKKRRRKQPKQDLAKLERRIIVGWILGGLIGGGVGAAIWTVGGNYTGYEFGFLAWGVGALAGIGLHVSGQGYGESRSGWIAVAIALFSIVIGRFAIFWSFTGSAIDALDIALGFFVDPLGVLWGGLARFTAYRIGSGSQFD